MSRRTFQRNFTLQAKAGLTVFLLLALYLFWHRYAVAGGVTALLVVLLMEQVLHSCYVFDGDLLVIHRGRFRKDRVLHVNEITRCTPMRTTFGVVHYLLLQYGADHLIDVEPAQEQEFMKELRKRQDAFIAAEHGEREN